MAKIVTLKDKNGENVYPSTFSTLIYDNNGKSVDSALNGLRGNISSNTSDEGKSIVINDSCNHGKLSISVKGNSSQNGTPTPETPVDIISCDNPTLYVNGKNLWDSTSQLIAGNVNMENGAYIATDVSNMRIDVAYDSKALRSIYIKKGTTISFSFKTNISTDKEKYLCMKLSDESYKNILIKNANSVTYTATEDIVNIGMVIYGSVKGDKLYDVQLELNDTITDFEPYKEVQTLKIPYVLRGIGDIKDEITISDSKVEYIQRIAEETVTLNELSETSDYVGRYIEKYKIKNQYKAASYGNFCTSAKYKLWALPSQTEWVISTSSRAIYFSPPLTSKYTADTLNAYLSDKPITLIGCLETPITTDITDTEFGQSLLKLHCNSPTTTIYTDSNVDITATYEISTSNYFQNKLAEFKTKLGGV